MPLRSARCTSRTPPRQARSVAHVRILVVDRFGDGPPSTMWTRDMGGHGGLGTATETARRCRRVVQTAHEVGDHGVTIPLELEPVGHTDGYLPEPGGSSGHSQSLLQRYIGAGPAVSWRRHVHGDADHGLPAIVRTSVSTSLSRRFAAGRRPDGVDRREAMVGVVVIGSESFVFGVR